MRHSWLLLLLALGCAAPTTTMVPTLSPGEAAAQRDVEKDLIRVRLVEDAGGGLFIFEVQNLSAQPIVVDREAVAMVAPDGSCQTRLPGGAASSYSIPSGGVHRVNVRYDLGRVHEGDLLRFDFSHAVRTIGGALVAMPMLSLVNA